MKKIKCIAIILIALLMISALSTGVFAYNWTAKINTFDSKTSNIDENAENIVGAIISVARIIAVGVAIIMLLVLAMKYMMAAPGDRADIKKHAVVYIVGAVVLFAGTGILTIIQMFAENINAS